MFIQDAGNVLEEYTRLFPGAALTHMIIQPRRAIAANFRVTGTTPNLGDRVENPGGAFAAPP